MSKKLAFYRCGEKFDKYDVSLLTECQIRKVNNSSKTKILINK